MWSGALATAGGVVFYGTLEGYLKAVDAKTGKELYKFKTPSGIIGNVMTYEHGGKQYVAVLSGVGGWAGIGLAAGLTNPTDGLGAVGGYAALQQLHGARRPADGLRPAAVNRASRLTTNCPTASPPRRARPVLVGEALRRASTACRSADRDKLVRKWLCWSHALAAALLVAASRALRRRIRDPTAVKNEDGKYFDKDGNPTYKVSATAPSIGTPIPAFAAIIRNATSATGPTAMARPMRRR